MSAEIYHFISVNDAPNRIRELRLAATPKMSQQKLADMINVSKPTISELERGSMALTQDYMRRISRALNVQPADLLPLTENPGALSAEEREIISRMRAADPQKRAQLHTLIDMFAPSVAPSPEDRKIA